VHTNIVLIGFFSFLYVVLNLCDAYLTRLILKSGGVEKNPIIRYVGLWRVKVAGTVALTVWLILSFHLWCLILPLIDILLFAVCVWNFIQCKRQRSQ